MTSSPTHLVLIPAFNPGILLAATVDGALSAWPNVWVIVDGSTDESHQALLRSPREGLRVIVLPQNGGKGAAIFAGAQKALEEGFTHALVMDADGQHPASRIADFMSASKAAPAALICGRPVFGPEAPKARLYGRKLSVGLVHLETSGRGAADPLFGFRVYPLSPLVAALETSNGGRRYDFDPEMAVRLAWAGTPAINLDAECVYVPRDRGGVSHFHYLRDNLTMIAMHTRLIVALLGRKQATRPSMRTVVVLMLLALSPAALKAADIGDLLTPASAAGEWKPLLGALAGKGSIQATFTELRYFPFRRDPTILTGILRVSPEKGLSLQYLKPDASTLIADGSGILLRDASGRDSAMPSDSHQAGAISSLLPIMRFDLNALFPKFEIRALRTGPDWRFEFRSRDSQAASALGVITVVGTGEDVRHLEFKRSEHQRIEIEIEDTRPGVVFTPADLSRFFR